MGSLKKETRSFLMNELIASSPKSFNSNAELKLLLDLFGPFTGRYHLSCPNDWRKQVDLEISDWPDIKKAKAKRLIEKALDGGGFVSRGGIDWEPNKGWIDNILGLFEKEPDLLKYIIAGADDAVPDSQKNIVHLDDASLPATEEEKMVAKADEYVRVSRFLLLRRPELIFIDPYLDPCNKHIRPVLEDMFSVIAVGRCESVKFWSRRSTFDNNKSGFDDVKFELQELKKKSNAHKVNIEFNIVDDWNSQYRMHARYLLSLKGGVKFDQGFQTLDKGKKVDVSPIGQNILDELITLYIEGKNGFKIIKKIKV